MGYSRTDYYETIIRRQIRAGRASNKSEVIHQALALLDAVSRGHGDAAAGLDAEDGPVVRLAPHGAEVRRVEAHRGPQ